MHLGVSIKRDSTVHMHLLRHCIIYSVCMLGKIIVETCYGHIIVFMHAYKLYIIVVWQMCGLTNQTISQTISLEVEGHLMFMSV